MTKSEVLKIILFQNPKAEIGKTVDSAPYHGNYLKTNHPNVFRLDGSKSLYRLFGSRQKDHLGL